MKKQILLCTALAACGGLFAQGEKKDVPLAVSHITADLIVGFNMPAGRSNYGTDDVYNGINLTSREQLKGTLGKGVFVGGRANYFMDPTFGVGIGVHHLFGSQVSYNKNSYSNGESNEETLQGRYTGIDFDIAMRTSCEGPWHGEASFGPTLFPCSGFTERYTSNLNGNQIYDTEFEVKNRMGLGFNAAFGGDYRITEKISLGLDFRTILFSARSKSGEYTKYNDNGTDKLASMKTYEKEYNYSDKLDAASNRYGSMNFNMNAPSDDLSHRTSYNSFSASLRVRYNLN